MDARLLFLSLVLFTVVPLSAQDESEIVPEIPFKSLGELTFLKTGDPLVDWNSRRIWTSTDGRALSAKLLAVKDGQGAFALANGSTATIPLNRFVEDDRRFIREWEAVSVYFNLGYETTRSVTDTVEAGIFDGAFAKEGKVHETKNFRFECDAVLSAEVVKDFSRLFEATYAGVLANPLGLALAKPLEGKFGVKLFSEDSDYYSAGGSADSSGVYLIKERVMLVPLSSLGLTAGSGGWRKTRDFDPRTLIHETTHALTHQWLHQAPMWFVEGFAEYIAATPYQEGRLFLSRHREGMADLAAKKFGGDATRFPLFSPAEITRIGHRTFMGEREAPETPVELPQVDPFQITLASEGAGGPNGSDAETASPMSPRPMEVDFTGAMGGSPDDGTSVVRRYVSSMALLGHLFQSGQVAQLRSYLFDFIRFEWDRDGYLTRYEEAHKAHHADVGAQIKSFEEVLDRYNAEAENYNASVAQYKRGEIDAVPTPPVKFEIPKALPVPPILQAPRAVESFSRQRFLESAWDKHLRFQGALSVAP